MLTGASAIAGSYTCVAANAVGTSSSQAATITTEGVAPSRLINLSVLTEAGAGARALTVGAVIGGASTGTLPIVARAVGPTLGSLFGVGDTLADPIMTINVGGSAVATNDDWGGGATLAAAFRAVGAFELPADSRDSAFVSPGLLPGNYTVQVAGKGSASGQVIAELYDASVPGGGLDGPRLINLSTLTEIGSGATLSVGFVLGGTTSRTILIRAVGPTLGSAFGLSGVMADPQLALYDTKTGREVGSNDNWQGSVSVQAIGARVGAFALADASSRDAVLLITLPPSNYSARVNGNTGGGTAILEVYEVP